MQSRTFVTLATVFCLGLLVFVFLSKPSPQRASARSGELIPDTFVLDATVRDFKAFDETGGHDDFQRYAGTTRIGLVDQYLGEDGKPILKDRLGKQIIKEYKDADGRNINPAFHNASLGDVKGELADQTDARIFSEQSFQSWYRDTPGVNISTTIPLTFSRKTPTDAFVFDSALDPTYQSRGGFFPIDGALFGNYSSWDHNFHFTTEVATEFLYKRDAGYLFKFTGDDDVWIFIDGRLVIDLGSLHPIREQYIDLDRLDWLQDGENYTLHMFHAERRTVQSNFRIETTIPLRPIRQPTITEQYD